MTHALFIMLDMLMKTNTKSIQRRKKEVMTEKKRENELAEKDDTVILLYIDLQKVPLSPSLQARACYYKSKLDLFT